MSGGFCAGGGLWGVFFISNFTARMGEIVGKLSTTLNYPLIRFGPVPVRLVRFSGV